MTDQSSMYQSSTYAGYEPPPIGLTPAGGGEDTSMKDKAAESTEAGKQAVADVAETAASQAKEVAAEAQNQAKKVVSDARDQLRSHAGDQHQNAVTNLRALGDELRSMAGNGGQNGVASDIVGRAADRAHGAANWLDGRQPEDLLDELRRLARQRPGAFLVGALAAGVVAGRLTRGVVAAHGEDSGSSSSANVAPQLQTAPAAAGAPDGGGEYRPETGYTAPVYGGQPYGTDAAAQPYGTDPAAQPYGTDPAAQPYGTDPASQPYSYPVDQPYGNPSTGGPAYPAGGGGSA